MPATESPQSYLRDALGPGQASLGMNMEWGWGVAEARMAYTTATSTPACIQGPGLLPLTQASFQGCWDRGKLDS